MKRKLSNFGTVERRSQAKHQCKFFHWKENEFEKIKMEICDFVFNKATVSNFTQKNFNST